jgi:hypothetical protein
MHWKCCATKKHLCRRSNDVPRVLLMGNNTSMFINCTDTVAGSACTCRIKCAMLLSQVPATASTLLLQCIMMPMLLCCSISRAPAALPVTNQNAT